MIIMPNSIEENLIKKSINRLNILVTCRNIQVKKKTYKSLFRLFMNNPDVFRFLNREIYKSLGIAILDSQFNFTTIAIRIKYIENINYDMDLIVDENDIKSLLYFISRIKVKMCITHLYNEFYTSFKDFEEV